MSLAYLAAARHYAISSEETKSRCYFGIVSDLGGNLAAQCLGARW